MSWWTKNRKKVGLAAGLLGASFIPGAPAALASALGGGSTAAGGLFGEGALTAAITPGLSATGAGSQAAMLAAQNAGMGLQGAGLTAEAAAGAQGLSQGAQAGGQALGMFARGAPYAGTAAKAFGTANQAMNLAQGPQQAPPPPPPPSQFQPTPVNPAYGMGMDSPPPGIDPRQWAMMTPDQKRRFKGGY